MDPHFLHGARLLEPVLSPPVDLPAALTWRPDDERLLVATRSRAIFEVDPTGGTRRLLEVDREPALVSALPDGGVLVLSVEGHLQLWRGTEKAWERTTGLLAGRAIVVAADTLAVAGDDGERRRVLVLGHDGTVRLRARVPARTAIGLGPDGLVWARSVEAGVTTSRIGEPLPVGTGTQHQLTITPVGIVGVTDAGLVVWTPAATLAIRQGEVGNVALDPSGRQLALGTKGGSVALVRLDSPDQRRTPARVDAHTGPVRGLAFAPRGRWLASMGDRCRVWSYSPPTASIPP